MLRTPYLPGESDMDQLKTTFRALGTPTEEEWPVSRLTCRLQICLLTIRRDTQNSQTMYPLVNSRERHCANSSQLRVRIASIFSASASRMILEDA